VTVTLCPDDFSNSKTSPGITVRKAPAHKNLISAALATLTPIATSNKHEIAATAANDVLNIAVPYLHTTYRVDTPKPGATAPARLERGKPPAETSELIGRQSE
jgi:hypothetical protein